MSGHDLDEPVGYLALPKGTPVVTSDGTTVGKVYKVMHHERERIFDGLVVQTDDGRRFVDAPEVKSMTRRHVELEIDSQVFAQLSPPHGLLNALDSEARRTARRLRRRLPGG
jgi:sporulation protein YlmC with PRC-barrel domain